MKMQPILFCAVAATAAQLVTGTSRGDVVARDSFDVVGQVAHLDQSVNPPLFNVVPGAAVNPAVTGPRLFNGIALGDLVRAERASGLGWFARTQVVAGLPTAIYDGWSRNGGARQYYARSGLTFSDRPQFGNAVFFNQADGNSLPGNPVSDGLDDDQVTPLSSSSGSFARRTYGVGANSTFYASMLAIGPQTTMSTPDIGLQFAVHGVSGTLGPVDPPKFTSPLLTPSAIASNSYSMTGIDRATVDFDFSDFGAYSSGQTHPTGAQVGNSFLLGGTPFLIVTKFANVNPTTPGTSESVTWILNPANYDAIKLGVIDEATLDANSVSRISATGQQYDFAPGDFFGVQTTGVNSMYLVNSPGQPAPWNPFIDEITLTSDIASAVVPPVISLMPQWATDGNGIWMLGSNWTPATAPNAVGATANFGARITQARTVTVDAPKTVGTMNFYSSSKYTLAGAATLMLNQAAGSVAINVTSGSHDITAPLVLAKDAVITVTPSANTLTVSNLQASSVSIIKAGSGKLVVNNIRAGTLTISAGKVSIISGRSTSGTSNVAELNIATGKTLDLGDQDLVINHSGVSPLAAVKTLLTSGYASGAWTGTGITSASAAAASGGPNKTALGYGEAAALGYANSVFSGQNLDADALLIRYTYSGDANLDGRVNTIDFNSLAGSFGQSGKIWSEGNFNYDAAVDSVDFSQLVANYGMIMPIATTPMLGTMIPEPACASVLAIALILPKRRR